MDLGAGYRGGVPLGGTATSASAAGAGTGPQAGPGGAGAGAPVAVVDVTEETFTAEVLERSRNVPVVIDFWAEWCGPCKQLSPVLERLARESQGRWVLAKIDVDANPRLAQAAQVQGIPAVKAVIGGQVVGEFTGVVPEQELRGWLDQVRAAAAQMGVTGTEPAAGDEAGDESGPQLSPEHQAAEELLAQGDAAGAQAAYERILAAAPADAEARAGLARARLLGRALQPGEAQGDAQDDAVAAELAEADTQLLSGDAEGAFARLIALVRAGGDGRDAARERLLELFDAVGSDDPRVGKARRDLASALF